MSLSELQQMVGEWHVSQFDADCPLTRLFRKLREEHNELQDAEDHEEAAESADVLICLLAIAHRRGFDLDKVVTDKFEIVRNRDQRKRDEERGIL